MKIRTDFVTNSSSSSYVTVLFEMKDGTKITSKSCMDDIGHGYNPESICFMSDDSVAEMLANVKNGAEFLKAMDEHYCGMFYVPKPDDETSWKMSAYREFNAEAVSEIDFQNVKTITINDVNDGDYGRTEKDFCFDPETKTVHSEEYIEEPPVSDERLDELYEAMTKYVTEAVGQEVPEDIADVLKKAEKYYCQYHDSDWNHPLIYLLEWYTGETDCELNEILADIGASEEETDGVEEIYWG